MNQTQEEIAYQKLYSAHEVYIASLLGTALPADTQINVGWSSTDTAIMSKCYMNPRKYVHSYYDENDTITHELTD